MRKWLNCLLACFVFVLLIPFAVSAETTEVANGTCGENLTWVLDSDGTLTISGSGLMADYALASEMPWYSNRTTIKEIVIGNKVSTIGDRAFYGCTALTDVTIGNSVTSIGTYAFRGCTALAEVTVPANVTQLKDSAFRACTALTTITFMGNAPATGNYVFNDGAGSMTVQYYEDKTGFVATPWTDYASKTLHVGQWIIDKMPSCTEDGSRYMDCPYCNETITEIIPGGHNYVEGICTVCHDVPIIASGKCGINVEWRLDGTGELTISGTGNMRYYPSNEAPWYANREEILTVEIQEGVTSIGWSAFHGCSGLTSVTIPSSVTSIGMYAFRGCSSLTNVTIPESVTSIGEFAFSDCSSLTNVTIPESVTSIDEYAFGWCSSLTSITIPGNETSIGTNAFFDCSSLESVTISEGVTSIGESAFSGCSSLESVTISEGVTSIGELAFSDCSSLTSVVIPGSVTSLGGYAFSGCSSLTSVTIPESVTSIPDGVFNGASSLTSIVIPESVMSIGHFAFNDCSSLTSVTIPESVTSLGKSAFRDCSNLMSITLPESVTSIPDGVFSWCSSLTSVAIPGSVTSIGENAFSWCSSLTIVTIPDSVTSIGESAFYDCNSLTSVAIPGSVTSVGESAFRNCSSLTSVTILEGVTSMGDCAFYDCSSLTSVVIPGSVTSLGKSAFSGCSSLTSVIITEGVTSISEGAFYGSSSLTSITIPGSVTSIGTYAFRGASIRNVYYNGTEDMWKKIDIDGLDDSNASLLNATIHFSAQEHTHSYTETVTKPTYTAQGYTTHTCSVCGDSYVDSYVDPLPLPEAEVAVARMILGNELAMQFAFPKSNIVEGVDYVVSVTKTYADGREDKTILVPQSEWKTSGAYYYVSFNGIAAKEMGDAINVQIQTAGGAPAGDVYTDSVRDYAIRQLRKTTDAKTRTLYVDMLNYGAAAQTYFGYNADNLVTKELTKTEKGYGTKSVKLKNNLVKGTGYVASQLDLGSSILLRVKFNGIDSTMRAEIGFTSHTGAKKTVTIPGSEFISSGTVVVIDDVVAADYNQDVTIKVYDANGTEVANAVESVASYLARQLEKPNALAIYDAVAKYCAAAYGYLHR